MNDANIVPGTRGSSPNALMGLSANGAGAAGPHFPVPPRVHFQFWPLITETRLKITHIDQGSLAAHAGLVPGDRIVEVDGRKVRDFLDLHLWLGEEHLDLTVEHENVFGKPFHVEISRRYGDELGLTFEPPRIRRCANDCPFCFVDQQPEGVRSSLRIRDDDYRFSYLYGHFITLTNLKEWEFERIIEQELSPLYISVHALDPVIREKCLKSPRAKEVIQRLEQLLEGGIELHTQVVCVPGLNDGFALEETVFGLAEYFPGVLSCSVVPVGLTGYREGLPGVATYTAEQAQDIVARVDRYGSALKKRLGDPFVHAADEFVVLARLPIPEAEYYGDFSQMENGVGLVRRLLMRFESCPGQKRNLEARGIERVLVVTGESFGPVLSQHADVLRGKLDPVRFEVLPAENRLFGRPTTVAGLLGGRDILREAESNVESSDLVLIPNEAVNDDQVFLDDFSLTDLRQELDVPVEASWESVLGDLEPALGEPEW